MIEGLRQVKEAHPLEFVVFLDDTFVLSQEWLREFTEKYPREIGLPFFCNTRANLVTVLWALPALLLFILRQRDLLAKSALLLFLPLLSYTCVYL